MKKGLLRSILSLVVLFVVMSCSSVQALENYKIINSNGIKISDVEYQNLLNLGFTENEILNMNEEEFENNHNLVGTIVSKKVSYLEDEGNNSFISTFGTQSGYISTASKTLTTTIISVSGRYRYKVTLEWKNMPSTRSYDILAIGMDANVKLYVGPYFRQNFCYSANNCSSSSTRTEKISSTGLGVSFKLPNASVVSMSSYMYFDVVKNTSDTITQLKVYGDYSHAKKTITETKARQYTVNRAGIVLNSSTSSYYDSIDTAISIWTGSW